MFLFINFVTLQYCKTANEQWMHRIFRRHGLSQNNNNLIESAEKISVSNQTCREATLALKVAARARLFLPT